MSDAYLVELGSVSSPYDDHTYEMQRPLSRPRPNSALGLSYSMTRLTPHEAQMIRQVAKSPKRAGTQEAFGVKSIHKGRKRRRGQY